VAFLKKHQWAIVVFLAVAAGNTALSFRDSELSEDQANMLAEVYKRQDPALYASDETFGPSGPGAPWRGRLPAWQVLLGGAVRLFGQGDPLNGFRAIGAAALLVYLLAMYVLLYRRAHSVSVAAIVTLMSTAIFSVRRPYWGIGPLFAVGPATVYLAFVPLVVLMFLRRWQRWPVVGVFFLAGACGNLHLPSAVNLVGAMTVVLVGLGRFRRRCWCLAGLSLLAAAVAAAPAIYHCARALRAAGVAGSETTFSQARDALELARMNLLYPGVLVELLRWLPVAFLLAAPAVIILTRAGRYRVRDFGPWMWWLAGVAFVALGLHGLMQLIGWLLNAPPPAIEFFQSLHLAMLPLYVLFAQAMVHLMRLAGGLRPWARAGLALLAVVYLGSGYNARPIRHAVRDWAAALGEREPPEAARDARRAELHAIARWAADQANTPADALFVCPHSLIRPCARRSLLCCPADVRQLYHLAPQRLADWARCVRTQSRLLKPPEGPLADADRIAAFVDSHWRRRGQPASATYVLIPAQSAPASKGRLREIPPPDGRWGRHWRLFRVLTYLPATTGG